MVSVEPAMMGSATMQAASKSAPADAHLSGAQELRVRVSFRTRARRWVVRRTLRAVTLAFLAARWTLSLIGRRPRRWNADEGGEILLTGTFHSANWINAHLRPLASSAKCARLTVVTDFPIPPTPKVELIQPSRFLTRLFGRVGARLLTYCWVAIGRRPHVVGGFHLLFNGLATALLARVAGSRSLYFCVGGPAEVLGGGIWSENRIFTRLEVPDPVIEARLTRAVSSFATVITMGARAAEFFRSRGVATRFHVVSGAIDTRQFMPSEAAPTTDVVFVGRLAQIKRVDVLLRAMRLVADELPNVRLTIVGDGELRSALESLASELRIDGNVTFAGARSDIGDILRQARLFVLTSDSEGLALSLMEAMTCGLPAVVSDVGDLGELVREGVNGHLVPPRDVERFAARITELLRDETRRASFARQARQDAARYAPEAVARQWDGILAEMAER